MCRRPYDKIGETLRAVYLMDRKPLTWTMIDVLETISELSDADEKSASEDFGIREEHSSPRRPTRPLSDQERTTTMLGKIPHDAFIVVADGTGARFFRNTSHNAKVSLAADGHLSPADLMNDGPAGHRPPESTKQETDEATFAKQLANELYRRAHNGDFASLVLIADPQTLGQIRPSLHKEAKDRMVLEIGKTLTKATIKDLEQALS